MLFFFLRRDVYGVLYIVVRVPGTLADLKKQRAQIRTNGSPVESSLTSTNNHSLNSVSEASKQDMPVQLNPLSLAPGAAAVPRFAGNTSDVVGDSRSHRCCIIM